MEVDEPQVAIPQNLLINITTDNASNISRAVKETGFNHIRCFAHTINLSVQKGLKVVDTQLAKLRKIIGLFHRSAKAKAALEVCLYSLCVHFHKY